MPSPAQRSRKHLPPLRPLRQRYLRMLMDAIFGKNNFLNRIVWGYPGTSASKTFFPRKHNPILCFTKSRGDPTFNEDSIKVPYTKLNTQHQQPVGGGIGGNLTKAAVDEYRDRGTILETWGTKFSLVGRLVKERSRWATQKPIALYSRCIFAATDPGDLVIDPFCGCATTLVAAENAGRQWIGIDRDPEAENQVVNQLAKLNEDSCDFWRDNVIIRTDLPVRTNLGKIAHYKKHFDKLYTKQRGVCAGCDWPRDTPVMTVAHDTPQSKGVQDNIKNLFILCSGCNSRKGTAK